MDFQKTVIKQFEFMHEQFAKMNQQFAKMNEQFVKIDQRFDKMDDRFDKMDELQDLTVIKLTEVAEKTDRLEAVQNAMKHDLSFVKEMLEEGTKRQKDTELEVVALHSRVGRCEEKLGLHAA